jgi:serine/threonine-protein kinase HipA
MSLDVYLHGKLVGGLFQTGEHGYRLAYRPETVEEVGAGEVLLSSSLPVREEPFGADASRAYVEGLLPQGQRRHAIAAELGLDPDDGYGLIAALGRDCPGAVVFLGQDEDHEPSDAGPLAWLSDDELEQLLQPRPVGLADGSHGRGMHFTLPGERHKLALVRDEEGGRWALPRPDAPSTHILKPESAECRGLVANEMTCTLAYRELGLPVTHVAVETIAGQTCLVSKRFDRWGDGPGTERLHQESFAQALGIAPPPTAAGGSGRQGETPDLAESCGLLRAIGEEHGAHTLMSAAFCDLVIGNCAARGANAALLFTGDGPILAPIFGIAATEIYGAERRRPPVIGAPPAPFLVDIRRTAWECDFEFQPSLMEAIETMARTCSSLNTVIDRAREEGWYSRVADEALQCATERSIGFRDEIEYLRPPGGEAL